MEDSANFASKVQKNQLDTEKQKQLEDLMTKGCDERIYLNDEGLTRYWVNLFDYKQTANRGACTCGSLNDDNVQLMQSLLEQDLKQTVNYEALLEAHTQALKDTINNPGEDKFEVFYGPSGTDLVYFPLLFAKILHPNRPILNILSCPDELGSGTLFASRGEYHANNNQYEEPTIKGDKVDTDFDIKMVYLDARNKEGDIIDNETAILEQISLHKDHTIIGSLVHGSKSGIQDNLSIMNRVEAQDNLFWNVDFCQFRHTNKTVHKVLDKQGFVMLTGSKFYQAPPFCGAILVSKEMMAKLKEAGFERSAAFDKVFSAYDFPASIRKESGLPHRKNISNLLRWACFLNEREKFVQIPEVDIFATIGRWVDFINKELEIAPEFELMPDYQATNPSIISFRVIKDGEYLNHKELKALYKSLVCDDYSDKYDFSKVFIGQPVAYGEKSFLRFALGSMNVRAFYENNEQDFKEDKSIIDILKEKVHAFKKA